MADNISPTEQVQKSAVDLQTTLNRALVSGLGTFMLMWSLFESVLEIVIWRETGVTPVHAVILVGGLGFERKASIARSLLALHGDKHKTAIALINTIVTEAGRNAIVHGQVGAIETSLGSGVMGALQFTKRDTDQSLKVVARQYSGLDMVEKAAHLIAQTERLQKMLGIDKDHLAEWVKIGASFASKPATSPKGSVSV